MSEFQEKLQSMKDNVHEDMNKIENNPALMSSDINDEEDNQLPYETPHSNRVSRNEKGHRKRKSMRERLDLVIAENSAKDMQHQQMMAYIQQQEARLAEAEAKAEQNAHYSNVYYEQSLENDEQRVLSELETAKESGDTKKEIELHRRLSDISAEKKTQLLSKTLQKQQVQPLSYQRPEYYQEPTYHPQSSYPPVDEHFEDFLEENPWADQNSAEYDSELSNEVNKVALELNKHLKFNNASHMIGTPQYYNSLSNAMKERYGIDTNDNNNNDYYVDNSAYEVAPVTKRGSSMADRYIGNRPSNNRFNQDATVLTSDEEEVSRHFMPVLSEIHGRQFTLQEAKAAFYKKKMENRMKPKNPLYQENL